MPYPYTECQGYHYYHNFKIEDCKFLGLTVIIFFRQTVILISERMTCIKQYPYGNGLIHQLIIHPLT